MILYMLTNSSWKSGSCCQALILGVIAPLGTASLRPRFGQLFWRPAPCDPRPCYHHPCPQGGRRQDLHCLPPPPCRSLLPLSPGRTSCRGCHAQALPSDTALADIEPFTALDPPTNLLTIHAATELQAMDPTEAVADLAGKGIRLLGLAGIDGGLHLHIGLLQSRGCTVRRAR